MAKNEKIRIRLKSYDHKLLDFSAGKIVETAKKAGIETIAIYDKYSDADTEAIKSQADFYLHNYTELLSSIDEL